MGKLERGTNLVVKIISMEALWNDRHLSGYALGILALGWKDGSGGTDLGVQYTL